MPVTPSSATLKCTEQLVAKIEPADEDGNPTNPNTVVWTSSDESVASLVPEHDGLTCHIIGGSPGTCNVVVNANASEGGARPSESGKKPVLGIVAVTVTAGDVATVKITTGAPVDQGTAPSQGLPSRPPRPDAGLPAGGAHPDHGLPSGGARPDHGLPPSPGHPDAGLPNAPARPDAGLPPSAGHPSAGLPNAPARPDQGLPPSQGRPDAGLPNAPARPDAGLPPSGLQPQPKK